MIDVPKSVLTSRTTQNSVAGIGSAALVLWAVLKLCRRLWPEGIPWSVAEDDKIVLATVAVLGPIAARQLAFLRSSYKKTAVKKYVNLALIFGVCGLLAS